MYVECGSDRKAEGQLRYPPTWDAVRTALSARYPNFRGLRPGAQAISRREFWRFHEKYYGLVWLPGGKFVEAACFTSEADSRQGETSTEFSGLPQAYMDLFGDMAFFDLRDPLIASP
jgi:hypothetical protein